MDKIKVEEVFQQDGSLESLQSAILKEVQCILTKSHVEAVGSVAIPMAGRREIDLMVISKDTHFDAQILSSSGYISGPEENNIFYLKKYFDGVEVGVQIIPEGHKMITTHRMIIEKLREDPGLKSSYEKFKLGLSGLSREEYKKQKSAWIKENLL